MKLPMRELLWIINKLALLKNEILESKQLGFVRHVEINVLKYVTICSYIYIEICLHAQSKHTIMSISDQIV